MNQDQLLEEALKENKELKQKVQTLENNIKEMNIKFKEYCEKLVMAHRQQQEEQREILYHEYMVKLNYVLQECDQKIKEAQQTNQIEE